MTEKVGTTLSVDTGSTTKNVTKITLTIAKSPRYNMGVVNNPPCCSDLLKADNYGN